MRTHVMKFSAPCPVVKQKHDAGNTVFNTYLKIRKNGDRILFQKWLSFERLNIWEFGMCDKNSKILRTKEASRMNMAAPKGHIP